MLFKVILRRTLFLYFSSSIISSAIAQFNVRFTIKEKPSFHTADTMFIAGSFNEWNPHDGRYKIVPNSGSSFIDIKFLKGKYEYKFARGGWAKVETISPEGGT